MEYWSTIEDDNLISVDKLAFFLQSEFSNSEADQIWSAEYFKWKLGSHNPAGKGYISLATVDDRVVGSISLTKKRILINGKEYLGAEIGDSYTSISIRRRGRPLHLSPFNNNPKSYLNRSIFGRLVSDVRRRAEVDGVSIIYGSPNANSYRGYIKNLNFFDLEWCVNTLFIRPSVGYFVKRYPSLGFISPLFRGIESFLIKIHKSIHSRVFNRGIIYKYSIPPESMIDNLWDRLKPAIGFSLVRDSTYWLYRYTNHPLAKYSFVSLYENNILVGIVVTRLYSIGDGKNIVSIAEWMCESRVEFGSILIEVVNYYRDFDIYYFNFWTDKSSQEAKSARRNMFFSSKRIPIIFSDTEQVRSLFTKEFEMKIYLGSTDNV